MSPLPGPSTLVVVVVLLVAGAMLLRRGRPAGRRLDRLIGLDAPTPEPRSPQVRDGLPDSWVRWACAAAAGSVFLLAPGWFTAVVAVVIAGAGPIALRRLEPRSARRRRQRCERDLPLALDLFAACLSGGASLEASAATVADAVGGPLGDDLRGVATRLRLGADPSVIWRTLGRDGRVQRVGVAIARIANGGTAGASVLSSMADEQRSEVRRRGEAQARQVAVRMAAPLGLLFLPAFVLLAIVPAVLGALAPTLSP